jgi:hypothetical protein
MTPLDEFEARWALVMPIPFQGVINVNVDTDKLPPLWGGALLQSAGRLDISLGSNPHVAEQGEILAALFARSGTGPHSLDASVTALRAGFHGYMTPDNTLQIRAVVGPHEIDPMANGNWWRLGFTLPYVVWSRRFEPLTP